jgi:beta-glucosidase
MATNRTIDALLGDMTLDEKVGLVAGTDMWNTGAVPRLGVRGLKVTDGPNGARGKDFRSRTRSACFPCGTALAATWNDELIYEVGIALADEARSKGAHVLLAPTVNIHRTPLAGRNFECYSEDPHLSARIAVGFVRGVQSRGIGTTVKHFVCNDSEFERHTISSQVDERTLREIYLHPFEAVVKEAKAWGLMSAYNRLDGTYCSENEWLLHDILREEWGFGGFVVSDWGGTRSTGKALAAGLDLEMPGPPQHRSDKLLEAVKRGDVDEAQVDACARRVLQMTERAGLIGTPESAAALPAAECSEDHPEHRDVALRAAAESIVLLKNDRDVLPLDARQIQRLLVVGPNADVAIIQGGGSAGVTPHYAISPLDGIRAFCEDRVEVRYEPGCTNHKTLPVLGDRLLVSHGGAAENEGLVRVEYFGNLDFEGEPVHTQQLDSADFRWFGNFSRHFDANAFSARLLGRAVPSESGPHTFGLVSAGRSRLFIDEQLVVDNWAPSGQSDAFFGRASAEVTGEVELTAGTSYEVCIEFSRDEAPFIAGVTCGFLPPIPADSIKRAAAAAKEADAAIVVVGLNSDWESEGHDRASMDLPGRQVELIRAVAKANRKTAVVLNAGAPVTMDWVDAVPAVLQTWYPGQEGGNALAQVLFGERDATGRLPMTIPVRLEDTPATPYYPGADGQVHYGEGVFVGYRHYDKRKIEPRFAFGHGLSYAKFEYGELRLTRGGGAPEKPVEFDVRVTNVGDRSGQEVVQVYVSPVRPDAQRPVRELRAFIKLVLEPGEHDYGRFMLTPRDFGFFDVETRCWRAPAGPYEIQVGSSSRDIRSRAQLTLSEDHTVTL